MATHETGEFPRGLRFVFVQMLFALTMGELAREAAGLIEVAPLRVAPSSYSHLILAFILITSSWVGWSSSSAPGNRLRVVSMFSWSFAVLVLDVVLVICYFIIVKGVEKPQGNLISASANNETTWILVVFLGYLIWDFITKGVIQDEDKNTLSFWDRISGRHFWGRGYASLVCSCLAAASWLALRNQTSQRNVILADGTLLALIVLFRALKQKLRVLSLLLFLVWIACMLAATSSLI